MSSVRWETASVTASGECGYCLQVELQPRAQQWWDLFAGVCEQISIEQPSGCWKRIYIDKPDHEQMIKELHVDGLGEDQPELTKRFIERCAAQADRDLLRRRQAKTAVDPERLKTLANELQEDFRNSSIQSSIPGKSGKNQLRAAMTRLCLRRR